MSVDWNYYDKFDDVIREYLPDTGEGDTMATQLVTAVNKIIYRWYNDGDVYDNTHRLSGWANDLSSYANWLYKYIPDSKYTLDSIGDCYNESDYEDLLQELADNLLEPEDIHAFAERPSVGSIYKCDGPFKFVDIEDEEDDYDWEESDSYYDEEEEY